MKCSGKKLPRCPGKHVVTFTTQLQFFAKQEFSGTVSIVHTANKHSTTYLLYLEDHPTESNKAVGGSFS